LPNPKTKIRNSRNQDSKFQEEDPKNKIQKTRSKKQDSKNKIQKTRNKNQNPKIPKSRNLKISKSHNP
jgi:hypothetical protein